MPASATLQPASRRFKTVYPPTYVRENEAQKAPVVVDWELRKYHIGLDRIAFTRQRRRRELRVDWSRESGSDTEGSEGGSPGDHRDRSRNRSIDPDHGSGSSKESSAIADSGQPLRPLRRPHGLATSGVYDEVDYNDRLADDTTLEYVPKPFLARQPIGWPVTSYKLLMHLEKGAKPFRFYDLPRELRNQVYTLLVDVGNECCEFNWEHNDIYISRPRGIQRLCDVSSEFRNEILRLYYSNNMFETDEDVWGAERAIHHWPRMVGMQHLRYLRSLKITFKYWYKGFWDAIEVTCLPGQALEAQVWIVEDYRFNRYDEKVQEHIAMIEQRKKDEKWESIGVMEFFTFDLDALRSALHGPRVFEDDPFEETDEHDAYQIAHGKQQIWCDGCPW